VRRQHAQPLRRIAQVAGGRHRLLLARDRRAHAFFHHGVQQRALALEVIERRAALHAHGGGDVARAGGVEALAPEQARRRSQDVPAAIAFVALLQRLARPAARTLGRGRAREGDGHVHDAHQSKHGYF